MPRFLYAVETVGPVYMVASGLRAYADHVAMLGLLALDMRDVLKGYKDFQGQPLQVRPRMPSPPLPLSPSLALEAGRPFPSLLDCRRDALRGYQGMDGQPLQL